MPGYAKYVIFEALRLDHDLGYATAIPVLG